MGVAAGVGADGVGSSVGVGAADGVAISAGEGDVVAGTGVAAPDEVHPARIAVTAATVTMPSARLPSTATAPGTPARLARWLGRLVADWDAHAPADVTGPAGCRGVSARARTREDAVVSDRGDRGERLRR
jgi:hypothetical protein